MQVRKILALTLSASIVGVAATHFALAQNAPAHSKTATTKPGDDVKGIRLTRPFTDITDLTPEEETQLKEIHKQFLEDRKKLEAKEMEDELAVLTDAQKEQVKASEAKGHSTTKPSMRKNNTAKPAPGAAAPAPAPAPAANPSVPGEPPLK